MSFDDERQELRRRALAGDTVALTHLEILARRFPRSPDSARLVEVRDLARILVRLEVEQGPIRGLPRPRWSRDLPWVLRVAGEFVGEFHGRSHEHPGDDARKTHLALVDAVTALLVRVDSIELLDQPRPPIWVDPMADLRRAVLRDEVRRAMLPRAIEYPEERGPRAP